MLLLEYAVETPGGRMEVEVRQADGAVFVVEHTDGEEDDDADDGRPWSRRTPNLPLLSDVVRTRRPGDRASVARHSRHS